MAAIAPAPRRVLLHARAPDDRAWFAALVGDLGAEPADLTDVPDAELHAGASEPVLAQTGGPDCPLDRLLAAPPGPSNGHGRPLILLAPPENLGRVATRTERKPHAIVLAEPCEAAELASILRATLAVESRRREVRVLLERLQKVNEELDARRREAEDEARRRTQFLAAISHDLRTPLWEIALFGQVVQAAATDPGTPVDWGHLATGLLAGVATLRERVDDLFDLARLDLGAIQARSTKFLLAPFLERVTAPFRGEAEGHALSLVVEAEPPWAEIVTDGDKLARILQNLVSNAMKFTEAGEVRVSGRVEPPGALVLSVRDTGRGIAPELLGSIFDEFAQLHNPERDRHKGTGLGLAISRRLARILGGSIEVESEVGQGSGFTLTLPGAASPA